MIEYGFTNPLFEPPLWVRDNPEDSIEAHDRSTVLPIAHPALMGTKGCWCILVTLEKSFPCTFRSCKRRPTREVYITREKRTIWLCSTHAREVSLHPRKGEVVLGTTPISFVMSLNVLVHQDPKDRSYYWATVKELPGLVTEGATLDELKRNVTDAIELYLSPSESVDEAPEA